MQELFEAKHYEKQSDKKAKCSICERHCVVGLGKKGVCGVRRNIDGKLYALNYGKTITHSVDPIEKKPLPHFHPGSHCLSIATFGCNFACKFCQNSDISNEFSEQQLEKVPFFGPKQIVQEAIEKGADGIAYTYTEPTIFFEYALDTMKIAKDKGLYNVWVSNGYMSKEVREDVLPFLDAINIDYKGSAKLYKELCGSNILLKKVEQNIGFFVEKGVHVEVTNLVVPNWNSSREDFEKLCDFTASLGKDIPIHFSRFFPHYKMGNSLPTKHETLYLAEKIARSKGLKNVHLGNI